MTLLGRERERGREDRGRAGRVWVGVGWVPAILEPALSGRGNVAHRGGSASPRVSVTTGGL